MVGLPELLVLFQYYHGWEFYCQIDETTSVSRQNKRTIGNHWLALSDKVISNTSLHGAEIEFTTLLMKGSNFIDRHKSNNHTISAIAVP